PPHSVAPRGIARWTFFVQCRRNAVHETVPGGAATVRAHVRHWCGVAAPGVGLEKRHSRPAARRRFLPCRRIEAFGPLGNRRVEPHTVPAAGRRILLQARASPPVRDRGRRVSRTSRDPLPREPLGTQGCRLRPPYATARQNQAPPMRHPRCASFVAPTKTPRGC